MQHIPPSLRRWSILVSFLAALIAIGILFSHFVWQPGAPATDAEVLQPINAPGEALDGSDPAAQLEAQDLAAEEQPPAPSVTTPVSATIVVYVTGAVRAPDVYSLPSVARVKDVVMAAGGFAADADTEHINLADHLKDAEHIQVPRQGEATNPPSADAPHGTNVATEGDQRVNINTASVAELDTLPGIGPALAQRIVDYRTTNGPFASIDDLSNVKGIGPTLLKELTPKISAESP
jgi:competence protein ComEA